jgi:hypothetical protein
MYYGNSGSSDDADYETNGSSAELVWDSNYEGVYHFQAIGATTADSTANGRDFTIRGTAGTVPGMVGNALGLTGTDASNDLVTSVFAGYPFTANHTMESFRKLANSANGESHVNAFQTSANRFEGRYRFRTTSTYSGVYDDTVNSMTVSLATSTSFAWEHVTFRKTAPTFLTINSRGVQTTGSSTNGDDPMSWTSFEIFNQSSTATQTYDEVRYSSVSRSDAWVNFYRDNIELADNGITIGAEIPNAPAGRVPYEYYYKYIGGMAT